MIALVILILLIVLYALMQNQEKEDCSSCDKSKHINRENLETEDAPKESGDFLGSIENRIFGEGEQMNHLEYSKKISKDGSKRQLWGTKNNVVNDRAWGIRPKRPYIMDPTSPFQYSAPDTEEMKPPQVVRLS